MSNISFFKKNKFFFNYIKTLKKEEFNILSNSNLKIDRAFRLYTVLNIDKDNIGEEYELNKRDIDTISSVYIKEYIKNTSIYLDSIGLNELYTIYDIKKISKYSYGIVLGFGLFNSVRYFNNLYYKLIPAILLFSIFLYFFIN